MPVAGIVIVLLGVFAGIIPFVGPLFNFGMGPDPAWAVTTSRVVRHVIPAIAVVAGGLMLMPRINASRVVGGTLAFLGGGWIVIAPIVLGRGGEPAPPLIDILRPLTYHFATGAVIVALAGFAIGRMTGLRSGERVIEERLATEPAPRRAPAMQEQASNR